MLRFAPIALSVVLVGCRPRATTSPGPERLADGPRPASVAPLPRDLPGYAVIDTTKYDNANLGLSYRYRRSDGFQADVYLYPLPSIGALCGTACAEQQAASIVSGFKETIPMLVERGYWDSVVPLSETAMCGPRNHPKNPSFVPAGHVRRSRRRHLCCRFDRENTSSLFMSPRPVLEPWHVDHDDPGLGSRSRGGRAR